MAIVHVASASFPLGTETSGGTFAIPSSGVSGDFAEVLITSRAHNSSIATPTCTDTDSGGNTWTAAGATASRKGTRLYKRLTNDSAGKVVTIAGCQNSAAAGIDLFRGVYLTGDPTSNFSTRQIESSDPQSHSGFTPDYQNSMVRLAVVNHTNNVSVTNLACGNPGSLEPEFYERLSSGGDDCGVISGGGAQSGATVATGSFTWAQNTNQHHVMVWALRPEPSAATTPPSSTSQNPVHTYNSAGTYRVTLTVTDALGRSATFSHSTVTVA
jgi:hypothetical protein